MVNIDTTIVTPKIEPKPRTYSIGIQVIDKDGDLYEIDSFGRPIGVPLGNINDPKTLENKKDSLK